MCNCCGYQVTKLLRAKPKNISRKTHTKTQMVSSPAAANQFKITKKRQRNYRFDNMNKINDGDIQDASKNKANVQYKCIIKQSLVDYC